LPRFRPKYAPSFFSKNKKNAATGHPTRQIDWATMLHVQFDEFPVLRTERLLLRQLTAADAPTFFRMRSHPEAMRYIHRPIQKELAESAAMIEQIGQAYMQHEGITWAVAWAAKPNDMLGTIGFWRMDKVHHRTEIGYMLHPDYWGQGIMSEVIPVALDYAFRVLDFHSIEANTDPRNVASSSVLLKHGFVEEAYFRENFFFEGQFSDSRIFSKLNPYHVR
jgi:[ribosomal protein S5]-alanine N-acetyltransferase